MSSSWHAARIPVAHRLERGIGESTCRRLGRVARAARQGLRAESLRNDRRLHVAASRALRKRRFGERAVSGLYQGYFDMTYFALFPPALRSRDLKIAIVFDYEAFAFEVWLAARNRKVQRRYWELFRDSSWSGYHVVEPAAGVDAIVEHPAGSGFNSTTLGRSPRRSRRRQRRSSSNSSVSSRLTTRARRSDTRILSPPQSRRSRRRPSRLQAIRGAFA